MQQFIDLLNQNEKYKSGQEYNLGDLIKDLEKIQDKNLEVCVIPPNGKGKLYPSIQTVIHDKIGKGHDEDEEEIETVFDSWRGSYCQLMIYVSDNDSKITVENLLSMSKEAVGKFFIGYKGGSFEMDESTPIHVCPHKANSGNDKITGIKIINEEVQIITRDDSSDD
jgi:hypothetical protein